MLLKQTGSAFDIDANAPEAPSPPESLKEAGITLAFLNDLILKALYLRGSMLGRDLGQFMCLPFKVVREALKFLKDEKNIEVMGGDLVGEVSYRFSLTDLGRRRAQEAMDMCAYCGPAPVPLEDYVEQTYRQAVTGIRCTPESLSAPFSHLVMKDDMFNALGPAIVSGRSVFIYGPPGNGKTAMARSIGEFMNQAGGAIYVPYAFLAEGSVITVYDPSLHQVDENPDASFIDPDSSVKRLLNTGAIDPRWVRIRRRVDAGDDGPEVQSGVEVLPGPDPLQGERRGVPDRRLRPADRLAEGTPQPVDPAARRPARLPHGGEREEVPGAVRAADHFLDQPGPERPGGRRVLAPD